MIGKLLTRVGSGLIAAALTYFEAIDVEAITAGTGVDAAVVGLVVSGIVTLLGILGRKVPA